MAIIKHNHAAAAGAKPFSMTDIEAHARRMLLQARQQADQLLAAAQAEAEAMKKQAQEEGLAAGLVQGKKEGLAQGKTEGLTVGKVQAFEAEKKALAEALATLGAAVTELHQHRHDLITQAEAEVLPLALAIARKVTKRLGDLDPRVVEANVREAVRLVTSKHSLQIAIHPSQRALLEALAPRLQQQWPQMEHVSYVDDATLAPGGCRVTTAGGEIDADLDTQLDRLALELLPTPE